MEFTPGLQRRLARLNPGFTYRQWPGFSPRTHPYGLAGTYVFVKQSGPPCHCDPRFQWENTRAAGTPSPEVTGLICRVPWPGVTRAALGFSPRNTCVGSRYGRGGSFPISFSWAPGVEWTRLKARLFPPSAGSRHYGTPRPSAVKRGIPPPTLSRGVGDGACVTAKPTPTAREY